MSYRDREPDRERDDDPEMYLPGMATRQDDEPGPAARFLRALLQRRVVQWRRRIALSVLLVTTLVLVYTLGYQYAMFTFEGVDDVTFTDALQVVIESLTTAGFGGDTGHWNTHAMNLFVVGMNLTGVLLVFMALPALVVPMFREGLEEQPRTQTDQSDHVVVCSYGPREETLRRELAAASVESVVIEEDPETVLELNDDGVDAILGDFESTSTYEAANVEEARAVVVDVADQRNVATILTVRERREDVPVIGVAEDEEAAMYQRYAGADTIVRPRQALGRSIGRKATLGFTDELRETVELSDEVELTELRIPEGSDLVGRTIGDANLGEEYGVTIVGIWFGGQFISAPGPHVELEANALMVITGGHEQLEAVTTRTVSTTDRSDGHVVVAGSGVVGQTVVEMLEAADVPHVVVDEADAESTDIVGTATDPETLSAADVVGARSVVLALDDDAATMHTAVMLERIAPDTGVLARANDTANTTKLYRAGVEYVLTLSWVTGQLIASAVLDDQDVLLAESTFAVDRFTAAGLAGRTIAEADVRDRTGAMIVAVERDDAVITEFDASLTLRADDGLIVVGDAKAIRRFASFVRE